MEIVNLLWYDSQSLNDSLISQNNPIVLDHLLCLFWVSKVFYLLLTYIITITDGKRFLYDIIIGFAQV